MSYNICPAPLPPALRLRQVLRRVPAAAPAELGPADPAAHRDRPDRRAVREVPGALARARRYGTAESRGEKGRSGNVPFDRSISTNTLSDKQK